METNSYSLVRNDLVKSAAAEHERVRTALAAERSNHQAAMAAVGVAERNLQVTLDAIAAGRDSDLAAANRAVADARSAVTVADQLVGALEARRQTAAAAHVAAGVDAWRPVYAAGVQGRIDAAGAADRARAMLVEAEQAMQAATRLIADAHAHGVPHSPFHIDTNIFHKAGRTEREERAVWEIAA